MMKGTTAFVNLQLLKNCLTFGIEPVWNLLVGFPGEGEDVYAKYVADIPRAIHLPPPQGVAAVRIDRFSPYFTKADEYGLELRRFDFYPLIYPFDEDSLARMAYFFTDVNYEAPYIKTLAQWITRLRARIHEWRARWESGAAPRLELARAAGGTIEVVDTRGAAEKRVALQDGAAALLAHLAAPKRQWELKTFGEQRGIDVARELAFLDAHGLVWQEGDTAFSLVAGDASGALAAAPVAAAVAAR
jgi:magnesium-protoporphyrin IX monomethyl ester (oxidative) cyclase